MGRVRGPAPPRPRVLALGLAVLLAGCGAAGVSQSLSATQVATKTPTTPVVTATPELSAADAPTPTPGIRSFESIYVGETPVAFLSILNADVQKSLKEATILPTTIIPKADPNLLAALADPKAVYAACLDLVEYYYTAYAQTFLSTTYTGAGVLYQTAFDAYWHCVSQRNEDPRLQPTTFSARVSSDLAKGVNIDRP